MKIGIGWRTRQVEGEPAATAPVRVSGEEVTERFPVLENGASRGGVANNTNNNNK